MFVSKLSLENWKNFRRVDVDLTPRVFIVGPNAAGKSNLLDVFRFLQDLAKDGGGLQRALQQRGGLTKVRCLAARDKPFVTIDVTVSSWNWLTEWRYRLSIVQEPRGHRQTHIKSEEVWKQDQQVLRRPDKDDEKDPERLTQTHIEQISANRDFRELVNFFDSVRYLHLVPQLLRNPDAFRPNAGTQDLYGQTFLDRIAKTPEKTRKSRLARIQAALQEAVPQLKQLSAVKDETGVPHIEARYDHWRPNAGWQREDQFSDGTLRLIGLFWSLLDGESPLLLEEPELSLHTEIVQLLPKLFSKVQRHARRQILVTTHSNAMLFDKSIGGEETLLLTPTESGTEVASLTKDPRQVIQLESGLSVGDVVAPLSRPKSLKQLPLF